MIILYFFGQLIYCQSILINLLLCLCNLGKLKWSSEYQFEKYLTNIMLQDETIKEELKCCLPDKVNVSIIAEAF